MALRSTLSLHHHCIKLQRICYNISFRPASTDKSLKMRFIQFLRKNDKNRRLGLVSEDGTSLTELSGGSCISHDMITFFSQNISIQELEEKAARFSIEKITDDIVLLPPVTNPGKIICIGLNYKDHCKEQNKPEPKEPMFFSKFATCLVGARSEVIAHKITEKIDWEVELAVIIGKKAKSVSIQNAMKHVFGYSIAQDISARDWQKERNGGQFLIGKSMDSFCPLGPSIVHKSLIKDIYNLTMKTRINGVEKQNGHTSQMIFKIDDVISRLSDSMTLLPGDIILTGTPKGVGMHRTPPEFLKPGDVIESEIECLGKLHNTVVAPKTEQIERPARNLKSSITPPKPKAPPQKPLRPPQTTKGVVASQSAKEVIVPEYPKAVPPPNEKPPKNPRMVAPQTSKPVVPENPKTVAPQNAKPVKAPKSPTPAEAPKSPKPAEAPQSPKTGTKK